jgi:hypothetical protein
MLPIHKVSSSYAPDGSSLASITIVGAKNLLEMSDEELDRSTRTQLSEWWGEERIKAWKLLKIYKFVLNSYAYCISCL